MKAVAKPVDMVAWFTKEGAPKPIRFRMVAEDEENITGKIHRIIQKDVEKLAGNPMLIFRCEGCLNCSLRQFEIKYELFTCKWILFRI